MKAASLALLGALLLCALPTAVQAQCSNTCGANCASCSNSGSQV
jgi:hypothetical protein